MGKNVVVVVSKPEFPEAVRQAGGVRPGVAYISIECTPECAKYWLEGEKGDNDNTHYLPSGPSVLNLDFDDLTSDRVWHGHQFKTITEEQAKETLEFIESHLGEEIIVHCKAGMSRSQGVARFILDTWPDLYEEDKNNPCLTPNIEVVSKLKQAWRNKYGTAFGNCT